jgi:tetratricopeptide (TPR) repeat protein
MKTSDWKEVYKDILAREPDSEDSMMCPATERWEVLSQYADFLARTREFDEAITQYQKALEALGLNDLEKLEILYKSADLFTKVGRPDSAMAQREEALRLVVVQAPEGPEEIRARLALARSSQEEGDEDSSVAGSYYERVLQLLPPKHPKELPIRCEFARWLAQKGDIDGARKQHLKIFELDLVSDRNRVQIFLSYASLLTGTQEANVLYTKALELLDEDDRGVFPFSREIEYRYSIAEFYVVNGIMTAKEAARILYAEREVFTIEEEDVLCNRYSDKLKEKEAAYLAAEKEKKWSKGLGGGTKDDSKKAESDDASKEKKSADDTSKKGEQPSESESNSSSKEKEEDKKTNPIVINSDQKDDDDTKVFNDKEEDDDDDDFKKIKQDDDDQIKLAFEDPQEKQETNLTSTPGAVDERYKPAPPPLEEEEPSTPEEDMAAAAIMSRMESGGGIELQKIDPAGVMPTYMSAMYSG